MAAFSHIMEPNGAGSPFFRVLARQKTSMMLKMGHLCFGIAIALRQVFERGTFYRICRPGVWIRGMKQHPKRCATRQTGSNDMEPIWRPVIGRCTPLSRARVIFRGGEVARRPFWLPPNDFSTIYFLV